MADFARKYMISSGDDCPAISASVATRIETGALRFADFIASVQEYAVDDDLTIRAKSIEYIAAVLALFQQDTLSRIEISMLVAFLRTRIDDNAGVKEASQGLRSLMGMTRFIKTDAAEILETIFKNTADLQRQPAVSRFAIYRSIEQALERCREVLEGMDARFIDGLLSLVEFEKDPRNLMVVFSILRVVMSDFPIEEGQTPTLWDAVFRYYPITYSPKPGDSVQITKSDLQCRLEACITSNSRFATYAFPSLLAKLDQLSATVKVEALTTTTACILSYSPVSIEPYVSRLWNLVKHEAYSTMDHTAALESVKLLKALVHKIYDEGLQEEFKRDLIKLATTDILGSIETITDENVRKAGLLVTAVACGSPILFSRVLESIMPPLLTIYQDLEGKISETASVLKLFGSVLSNANFNVPSAFFTPMNEPNSFFGNLIRAEKLKPIETLGAFRDQLLALYDAALRNQEMIIRSAALQGLVKLAKVPELLSYDEAGMIVQSLVAIVLNQGGEDELRSEAVKSLQLLSSITREDIRIDHVDDRSNQLTEASRDGAELIISIVFPALLNIASLPSDVNFGEISQQELENRNEKIVQDYGALACVSSELKVFEAFLKVTQTRLEQALHSSNYQMAKIVLSSILYGLERHIEQFRKSSGNLKFPLNGLSPINYQEAVRQLFSLVVVFDKDGSTIAIRQYPGIEIDDGFIEKVGEIAMLAFRSDQSAQVLAANEMLTLFVEGSDGSTREEFRNNVQSWYNSDGAPPQARRTIILTKCLLASIRPTQTILEAYDLQKMAAHIIQAVKLHSEVDSNIVGYSFSETLGLLVNKFYPYIHPDDRQIEKAIVDLLDSCISEEHSMIIRQTVPVVALAFQYTTAMVRRSEDSIYTSEDSVTLLNHLLLLLEGPQGQVVASGFRTLLGKSVTLNKQNHAVILTKHNQKLYNHLFPKVLERFEALRDNAEAQKNCLVALTNVISHISAEKWLLEQSPVTILLRTLDLKAFQPRPKQAALKLMIATARNHPESLIPHANSIINRLTTCISDEDAQVRALAVACCGQLPGSWENKEALKYKRKVVRALDVALADADARVRTEAVDCKMTWFNIIEPEDE